MEYQVKMESFSGPLDKLLELIEGKKMDIARISLAAVTADFLKYVDELKGSINKEMTHADDDNVEDESLRILADFLVVAAQLILIKSKAILPDMEVSQEEEEGMYDLEKRLKIYSEIKPMIAALRDFWISSEQSFSRQMFLGVGPVFFPPKNLELAQMMASLDLILRSLGSFNLEEEKIKKQVFTLEEKIKEISERISLSITKFSEVIVSKTKEEAVILFLALLHLLRDNKLSASQTSDFGEIDMISYSAEGGKVNKL